MRVVRNVFGYCASGVGQFVLISLCLFKGLHLVVNLLLHATDEVSRCLAYFLQLLTRRFRIKDVCSYSICDDDLKRVLVVVAA